MAAQFGITFDDSRPRVVLSFPQNPNDLLLSGTLASGQVLAGNRARLLDAPLGKGHVVMFAIRPFWRWQTQGTYSLGLQRDHELERSRRGQDRDPHAGNGPLEPVMYFHLYLAGEIWYLEGCPSASRDRDRPAIPVM